MPIKKIFKCKGRTTAGIAVSQNRIFDAVPQNGLTSGCRECYKYHIRLLRAFSGLLCVERMASALLVQINKNRNMKRYLQFMILASLWASLSSPISAKDVLASEFDPLSEMPELHGMSDVWREEFEREGRLLSREEVRKRVVASPEYEKIHPVIREWIDRNQANYQPRTATTYTLYVDRNIGVAIDFNKTTGGFLVNRTRVYGDDEAFSYTREPAINPATNKPWIYLTPDELQQVKSGSGATLSQSDKELIKDILRAVNENFHYFYGMEFVDLSRRQVDRNQLVGKFIPEKRLLFDITFDRLPARDESAQQRAIARVLGRPLYSYKDIIPEEGFLLEPSTNCPSHAQAAIYVSETTRLGDAITGIFTIDYWNQADPTKIDTGLYGRLKQLGSTRKGFTTMLKGLETLCRERGVDLTGLSKNKTQLTRALYLIHKKTRTYVDVVLNHDYVKQSRSQPFSKAGECRLSDVVPLPNVEGTGRLAQKNDEQEETDASSQKKKKPSSKRKKKKKK